MELFPETAAVRRVSLVKLAGEIARAAAGVGKVAVEGEVVKPKVYGGRSAFFTLRDRASQMTVRVAPGRLDRCHLAEGERSLVTGSLEYATERGELRLLAEEVIPVGEGAIAVLLEQVRSRLEADGLVDRPRRPVPVLPTAIGVVCGADAAVRADIESVVAARFPGYPMVFAETTVSGPGAVDAICAALAALDADPDVEVIVLARGGGDPTQLLPFSDEALCRAVAAARTPIVSAIGHDGDRPLCDLVADLRCGTPSLAAGAVVPDRALLLARLDAQRERVELGWSRRLDAAAVRLAGIAPEAALRAGLTTATDRLDRARERMGLVHPDRLFTVAAARLGRIDWRSPLVRRQERCRSELAGHQRHLEALSPTRVLERGYAVVRQADGSVVRDAASIASGDRLALTFARGRATAAVETTAHE